jgi:hypothetical protein
MVVDARSVDIRVVDAPVADVPGVGGDPGVVKAAGITVTERPL